MDTVVNEKTSNNIISNDDMIIKDHVKNNINNDVFYQKVKQEILHTFGVIKSEKFNAEKACRDRIDYLKKFLISSKRKGFVLGISGGVDSTTAGKLAQIACSELRKAKYEAYFYAVRLPAGVQLDEEDAREALDFISPDKALNVNIGLSSTMLSHSCDDAVSKIKHLSKEEKDFHKGNIKARLRMTTQYYIASVTESCVLGTDHNGEAIAAFWTRGGDEVADLLVLNRLNKRQVRLCAKYLGAPEKLWNKKPTADLEELNPGKLDDDGFGYSYEVQSDFLEGKKIDKDEEYKIIKKYNETRYRREPPLKFE